MSGDDRVSLAIPTLGRETVLVETIEYSLALEPSAIEIIVVDQTSQHEIETDRRLKNLESEGLIQCFYQAPSIPCAMNRALREAKSELLLFIDDDVIPDPNLIAAHIAGHQHPGVVAVVGQVLQPGESPIDTKSVEGQIGLKRDLGFCFRSTQAASVANVMAGNLSVKRELAIAAGGFDENFIGVAFRFETEFARRLLRQAGVIRYEPTASIRHLAAERGGTRTYGKHLISARPEHSVGDYYFAMLEGSGMEVHRYCLQRFARSLTTRFHLRRPWFIPTKAVGEIRGYLRARQLKSSGQKLIQL